MHRFKHRVFIAKVGAWRHAQTANQSRRQIADNVAVQILHQDHVKARGVLHQAHARGVNDHLLVVNFTNPFLRNFLGASNEQAVAHLHDVGFVEHGNFLASAVTGVLEGEFSDAQACQFRGHLQTGDHARSDFIFNARVQALCIFADHNQVHIFKSRGHAGQTANGPDRCVQTQRLSQRHIDAGETRSNRSCAWTLQRHAVLTNGRKRGLGQCAFGTALHCGKSRVMAQPLNVRFGRGKNAAHRRGNFRTNTITRNKDCLNCHIFLCG